MDSAVKIQNLTFGFNDKFVLKNINLDIAKGDYVGIIGPNGSGKSTLVKLILGILKPDVGNIKILGQDIFTAKNEHKIGYISQKANSFNSNFPATVFEVVGAGLNKNLSIFGNYDRDSEKKIIEALEVVDLRNFKDRLIGTLSGGQQQRVFIARALVNSPQIIFLDEPMVGVDAKSEEAVYCLLARLNKDMGITIVMVTHDIGAITVHANKIMCLGNKGIQIHDTENIFSDESIAQLYEYGVNIHAHRHDCFNCKKYKR